jgi:hypothetical protein
MKYYKILMDDKTENDIVCHYTNDYGIGYDALCQGKEFHDWNDAFMFYYDEREGNIPTDYLANDKGWFLISAELKELLREMNIACQYFRIPIIEATTGTSLEPYYGANILKPVDALCLDASEYSTMTTKNNNVFYSIKKFAVHESKLYGVDVFKLATGSAFPIFVSERFKGETMRRNLTGMDFREIRTVP